MERLGPPTRHRARKLVLSITAGGGEEVYTCWVKCWTGSTRVVAMLAEIFIVRLEAAARLQEQTASLSSSPFVPFTPSNQFVFKDRTARPADRPREAGHEQVS